MFTGSYNPFQKKFEYAPDYYSVSIINIFETNCLTTKKDYYLMYLSRRSKATFISSLIFFKIIYTFCKMLFEQEHLSTTFELL